ncbi:MAG: Grx4 family monothiol glutaredoxin [Pelagibacteraceae bacterium]|jgi:monothiol glutaredoxin
MNTEEKIKNIISSDNIVLFMKGTPDMPQCGFSMAVANVLKHLGVKFTGINVLEDEEIRNGIKVYSDWPTIPQLYIKNEFIGGCDIVREMFEKKELQTLLDEKKINYKK